MQIDVVTIFPDMFRAVRDCGVSGRAFAEGRVQLRLWDPRDYTRDRHRTVDDRPYGGGPGMVMMAPPLVAALDDARAAGDPAAARVAYMSPQGRVLRHRDIAELAQRERLILLAGRYEGIDERVLDACVDEEWSIGEYVLSGGELAAMVVIDAVIRQLPGALGNDDSAACDSFVDGLLDCGHYTRPEEFAGRRVPPVLLSGDHRAIARWRRKQALGRTWLKRPDLLAGVELSSTERELLSEFQAEHELEKE